jgi:hypothetical protein
MGLFEHFAQNHDEVDQASDEHKGSLTHEMIGGAAGFAAMKAYEAREAKEGKTTNHAFAKELLAGFAAAEVDKLCETKGLDFIDREKAKRQAKENAENMYSERYGQ